ncbi:MAG TPA: hypothetical protein VJP41_00605 [Gaiellaceae bacterium]|nr:hypothetical protein [Gaiellaceae bacterium]
MTRRYVVVATIALAVALAPLPAFAGSNSAGPIATFEGSQIDLSQGWGAAQACVVANGAVTCFADRAGLLAYEQQLPSTQASASELSLASTTCSSPLRLYADANYGGRELDFYDRGYWQNLSTWSFSNQTSSFKVGACAVDLADDANGGGSWYPSGTGAGHLEPTMVSGWNDRISSIFIQ